MRGVGGHEDAASHASHQLIDTAVAAPVPGVDALVPQLSALNGNAISICPVWGLPVLYRICAIVYHATTLHDIREAFL